MNEIISVIRDFAENAVQQADKSYRVSMLKLTCTTLNKLLAGQYRELGAAVYRMCREGKEDPEEIAALTVQIDGTRRRIAATERRIADILGLVRCPDCGSTVKMKNAYCSACGRKLAATDEEIYENENEMPF